MFHWPRKAPKGSGQLSNYCMYCIRDNSLYKMDTFSLDGGASLSKCKLEYGNGVFYPELEYDNESKVRIFNDLMAYAMRKTISIKIQELNSIWQITTICIHFYI